MTDREKVLKGLKCCIKSGDKVCPRVCTFYNECFTANGSNPFFPVMHAVLKLLKEQEVQPDIVRCKDCKYWQDNNGGYPHPDCRWREDETPDPDDYCSFGEVKHDV